MNKIASKLADSVRQAKVQNTKTTAPKKDVATKAPKEETTQPSFSSNRVWPD